MNKITGMKLSVEHILLLVCLTFTCVISGVTFRKLAQANHRILNASWLTPLTEHSAKSVNPLELKNAVSSVTQPVQSRLEARGMFISELRVAAIGSAYPIPYDAAVCPFTDIPQPEMNQLDHDSDGITDDWELKYGLDKYNAADAREDMDDDGFTNLEEFQAGTNPDKESLHPPYATKLRFVERKWVPFPLVFQGVTRLSDGTTVFQLNSPADGMTHFASIGEEVEGVLLQRFIEKDEDGKSKILVLRNRHEIELIRGEISADPESQAELINILDREPIIVTMGALLSLRNDEYMVLGVYADKVVIKHCGTGEVFDIIGLAEGK